jgi:signal transduction histidine kinase
MFLSRKTKTPIASDKNGTVQENNELKSVTESLYKQNLELAVKNKTLSLLSKLYEISILTLEPKELATRISDTIRTDFSFELVGIMLYDKESDVLKALAFSESDRLHEVESNTKVFLETVVIEKASVKLFLRKIFEQKTFTYTEEFTNLWDTNIPKKISDKIKSSGHIRSSFVYPLIIEEKIVGVFVLCMNRLYSDLAPYEKESIQSFINVIAVALDKALIYEQLKVTNLKLEKANDRLRELDKQKSEFVSFASHQLRSPLTSIKGYASLMLEGDYGELAAGAKEAAQRIYESSKTLAVVVNDYLNISRIELGTMKYEFKDLDLKALTEEVIAELKPNVEKTGLKLEFSCDMKASYIINADLDKFKQVMGNLIDNSLKYTPNGSIQVFLSRKAGSVVFAVKDTGIGMSEKTIPKLFQKFSRADKASETNIRGTGLGLYIAKEIVEAHKGRIWAESEGEGKGSQFYVEIPAR